MPSWHLIIILRFYGLCQNIVIYVAALKSGMVVLSFHFVDVLLHFQITALLHHCVITQSGPSDISVIQMTAKPVTDGGSMAYQMHMNQGYANTGSLMIQ